MTEFTAEFTHFRPAGWEGHNGKSPPEPGELFYYSRSYGWGDTDMMNWLDGIHPCPRGGATVCRLKSEGEVVATAVAVCSYSDNFDFARGRHIAYKRALDRMSGEPTGPYDHDGESYMGDRYIRALLKRKSKYMNDTRSYRSDEEDE